MIEFCSSARFDFPQFPQFRDGSAHRATWLRNEDLTQKTKTEESCTSPEIKPSARRGAAQQKAFGFRKHLRFPQFRHPEIVETVESPGIVGIVETSNQSNIYIVPSTITKYFRSLDDSGHGYPCATISLRFAPNPPNPGQYHCLINILVGRLRRNNPNLMRPYPCSRAPPH